MQRAQFYKLRSLFIYIVVINCVLLLYRQKALNFLGFDCNIFYSVSSYLCNRLLIAVKEVRAAEQVRFKRSI